MFPHIDYYPYRAAKHRPYFEDIAREMRSLTNMFEVMVGDYAKKLGLHKSTEAASKPASNGVTSKRAKK